MIPHDITERSLDQEKLRIDKDLIRFRDKPEDLFIVGVNSYILGLTLVYSLRHLAKPGLNLLCNRLEEFEKENSDLVLAQKICSSPFALTMLGWGLQPTGMSLLVYKAVKRMLAATKVRPGLPITQQSKQLISELERMIACFEEEILV